MSFDETLAEMSSPIPLQKVVEISFGLLSKIPMRKMKNLTKDSIRKWIHDEVFRSPQAKNAPVRRGVGRV
jgi:hypothetical protein